MILFTLLIILIFFASKKVEAISIWSKKITHEPYNYLYLIGLLLIGFFLRLDYTDKSGDIYSPESIFEVNNIIFSAISLVLLSSALLIKKRSVKLTLIIIESIYWMFKLFYFKGGYCISIAGIPDPIISFYDTMTLVLRLFIINSLFSHKIRNIFIILGALFIISIKVFFLPVQLSFYVERIESLKRAEITKELISGNWEGVCKYVEKGDSIVDSVKFQISPKSFIIYGFKDMDSLNFDIKFEYEDYGFLHQKSKQDWPFGEDWRYNYNFNITHITKDSLDMYLTQSIFDFTFLMTRTTSKKSSH